MNKNLAKFCNWREPSLLGWRSGSAFVSDAKGRGFKSRTQYFLHRLMIILKRGSSGADLVVNSLQSDDENRRVVPGFPFHWVWAGARN